MDNPIPIPGCLVFGAVIVWVFGSWAGTFEPPATELLCEAGHGSHCVSESAAGEPDRWVALDDSWRTMAGPRNLKIL